MTTPGGFGNRNRLNLATGAGEAIRDVFGAEIPHYFRYLFTDDQSVAPASRTPRGSEPTIRGASSRSSAARGTGSAAGTGWSGDGRPVHHGGPARGRLPRGDRPGRAGGPRLPLAGALLQRRALRLPAVFQEVVRRLHARYDHLVWMKLSELSAVLGRPRTDGHRSGPGRGSGRGLAIPGSLFLSRLYGPSSGQNQEKPVVTLRGEQTALRRVDRAWDLAGGTWRSVDGALELCFDLRKGESTVSIESD